MPDEKQRRSGRNITSQDDPLKHKTLTNHTDWNPEALRVAEIFDKKAWGRWYKIKRKNKSNRKEKLRLKSQ